MPKPEQESKMIIVQLKSENAELKKEIVELKEENMSLKARLNAYESKYGNYPSPTTIRTGMR